MNGTLSATRPTRVRYGVLAFAAVLSMVTYLDRVCFGKVAPYIQEDFGLTNFQLGSLFSAFALAYAIFEVPSGWLGDVFGARRMLVRIVIWWSVFTALTGLIYPTPHWPVLAFALLLGVRFLFGLGEAGAYPTIARAFYSWFPFHERGFAQGTVWMAGRFAGGMTPLFVGAIVFLISRQTGKVYWRPIFWVFGCIGLVWCLLFWFWYRDRPEEKAEVNQAELDLIHGRPAVPLTDELLATSQARVVLSSGTRPEIKDPAAQQQVTGPSAEALVQAAPVGQFGNTEEDPDAPSQKREGKASAEPPTDHGEASHWNVPWLHILGSGNLWLLCLMYFCASYGWYFNITWLPKYLGEHFDVTEQTVGYLPANFLAGAPLLFGALACLVGGLLTDRFIRRTGNRKWGRRLFGIVGHGVCAICYFASIFVQNPWLFVLSIAMASFWNDFTMGSAWASCIDIGGRYSGIVSGCMNTVGNLGGFVAGISTGLVLDHFGSETGWRINFISYSAVYVLATLCWLGFDATRPVTGTEG